MENPASMRTHVKQEEQLRVDQLEAELATVNAKLQESNRTRHDLQIRLQTAKDEARNALAAHGRLKLAEVKYKKKIEHLESHVEYSWKVSYNDIRLEKEIGRGGYGAVYIGQLKVAVKQLHRIIMSPKMIELMNREIDIMSKLRHPNLLFFIAAVFDDPSGNPLIITELMDMSLRDAYEKNFLASEREKLVILKDAAAGLNYLHCLPDPIIHRDVSSANVLLSFKGPQQWVTKISDFGSAKLAEIAVTDAPGARIYSAPEALLAVTSQGKLPQTTKMDVFSFGILLCEVMTNQLPGQREFQSMLQRVKKISPSVYGLICQCIEHSYDKRPTMSAVIDTLNGCITPPH